MSASSSSSSSSVRSRFSCAARHFAVVLTITSIVIVIAVPSQAQADPEELLVTDIEKRAARDTYCGRKLVDALRVVCAGSYNSPSPKNKKNIGMPRDELMRQQENDPEYWERESQDNTYDLLQGLQAEPGNSGRIPGQPRYPFRERLNTHAFLLHAARRSTRGVHDECCAKSCTIQELRAYCAAPT